MDQTVRRVLEGEKVPAEEKVVSLFEPHTDIIIKGGRRVQFGHKLNLSAGPSGLVLDAVVESGNPADSSRCIPMIERHAANFGSPPEQVALDGGYASRANLEEAKAMGVREWVWAIYLELTSLKGVSSIRLHRDIGLSQKTAWFMLHRIREAFTRPGGALPAR
ncbi:MAG: hypothetical protein OXQ94_02405 [Gemmatimonadota bacterium]|nr:hypothetical protein [Gemmatimonadota bacterium]